MQAQERKQYHFIGIGGVGMSALAHLLLQQGMAVSGSDCTMSAVTEALSAEGATIYAGHAATHVPSQAIVVYSSDILKANCEWQQANQNPDSLIHRSQLLAELMHAKHALTVTGTHGKTTTSALLAWVLTKAGRGPSFAIGGFLKDSMRNSAYGTGLEFIAEADESDGSFLHYYSFGSIVTNVDADHLPHFGSIDHMKQAFAQFMRQVKHSELLFWCMDDVGLQEMAAEGQIPAGVSYGWNLQSSLRGFDYTQEGWNSLFSVEWKGKVYRDVCVALPGRHGALNALAVFGMACALGVDEQTIRQALASFPGVDRRFSIRDEVRSVMVIDDYAHHPVEIRSALQAIGEAVEGRRVIAVYQPHRYTRAQDCVGTYKGQGIFDAADCVLITDIYAAGEPPIEGISHLSIVQEVKEGFSGLVCEAVVRENLENRLFELLRPHDVVVCLGAGDISAFSRTLPGVLRNRPITKYKLALLCGGPSSEHSVSLLSMEQLLPQWNPEFYTYSCFGITQKGQWIEEEALSKQLKEQGSTPERKLQGNTEAHARLPRTILDQLQTCDMIVPVLHGEWGEDGTLQGFCEVLGIPYVGCEVRASATCMDKSIVKALCLYHGIPAVPTVTIRKPQGQDQTLSLKEQVTALGSFPYWVKPAHLGSSVCVSRVCNFEQLEEALKQIFLRDDAALIEKEMVGRELECAVLGNGNVKVFVPGEVLTEVLPYDYEGKYCSESTPTEAIAKLTEPQAKAAMELSKQVYTLLGCRGLARVDLFLDADGRCYLNEVNTLPGFTRNSLYPRMCVANGLSISALLDQLVILGLETARIRRKRHVG